jgi:hypothetical protein
MRRRRAEHDAAHRARHFRGRRAHEAKTQQFRRSLADEDRSRDDEAVDLRYRGGLLGSCWPEASPELVSLPASESLSIIRSWSSRRV